MLEGGVRRVRMQVSGRDIGGWVEEYQDRVEWQGWWGKEDQWQWLVCPGHRPPVMHGESWGLGKLDKDACEWQGCCTWGE